MYFIIICLVFAVIHFVFDNANAIIKHLTKEQQELIKKKFNEDDVSQQILAVSMFLYPATYLFEDGQISTLSICVFIYVLLSILFLSFYTIKKKHAFFKAELLKIELESTTI